MTYKLYIKRGNGSVWEFIYSSHNLRIVLKEAEMSLKLINITSIKVEVKK